MKFAVMEVYTSVRSDLEILAQGRKCDCTGFIGFGGGDGVAAKGSSFLKRQLVGRGVKGARVLT